MTEKQTSELTNREKELLPLFQSGKSVSQISEITGIKDDRTIRRYGKSIREKGYILRPENISDKIGHVSQKVTSRQVINEDGIWIEKERWIRERPEELILEQFHKSLEDAHHNKFKKIKQPSFKSDICLDIPIGDPHFGLHTWSKESGDDYDLKIATDLHWSHITNHIDAAGNVEKIRIFPLGDMLHMDSRSNRTEKSGHVLDADTRFFKVIDAVTNLLVSIIEYAAERSTEVIFSNPPGNHDWHSSQHVARTLDAYFRQTDHIKVDTRPSKVRYFEYGKTLTGLAHGDTEKPGALSGIMAHDEREAWGRTVHHNWYTGHIHNQKIFEFPSCVIESFNTLAGKDSYTSEHAYRSRRKLTSIILDKEHGEVERKTTVVD